MSKEHLKNIAERSDFLELTSKGGSVKSEAKSRAAKIRGIKMMKQENVEKKALQLALNPKTTALEIMRMIVILKEKGTLKPQTEIQLIRALSDAYKTIFGNKVQLDANVNVKSIQMEYNIKDMAMRLAEHKYIEKLYPEWVQRFGEEQAKEMYNYLIYKYKLENHILEQMARRIREMLCKVSLDYEKKTDVEFYTEKDYKEFEEKVKNKEAIKNE